MGKKNFFLSFQEKRENCELGVERKVLGCDLENIVVAEVGLNGVFESESFGAWRGTLLHFHIHRVLHFRFSAVAARLSGLKFVR